MVKLLNQTEARRVSRVSDETARWRYGRCGTHGLHPRLNPKIGIAREFFTAVLKDYRDWREKWWREAIQNSVDAGGTRIRCEVVQRPEGEWVVACTDDGRGMDLDTLVNKFLMLGATTKIGVSGSAGGFGKAKELLILPWLQWTIETRDHRATGTGIDYEVTESARRNGTRIEVDMPADEATSAAAAVSFIEKCYLPDHRFTVFWQPNEGDSFEKRMIGKLRGGHLVDQVPGKADIFVTDADYTSYYMLVRANGLYMFESWVGQLPKQQLIVEITAPSIEILTANRDGFRDYEVQNAVGKLASRVQKDVLSALAKKSGQVREKFEGRGKFVARQVQQAALEQIGPVLSLYDEGKVELREQDIAAIANVLEVFRREQVDSNLPSARLAATLMDFEYAGPTHVVESVKQLVWEPDFYLVNEIDGYRVPKKFWPQTMAPRVLKLIKVWTELCRYTLMQLGHFREFGVGFIFSTNSAAAFLDENGEQWLMLNPHTSLRERNEIWSPTKSAEIRWLYAAAVHECTHLADGISYHDEAFARALTYNIARTADGFRKVRGIVTAITMAGTAVADMPRQVANPHRARADDRTYAKARVARMRNPL